MRSASDIQNVTQLLSDWQNNKANPQISELVYDTMRRLSAKYIRQEKQGYTLQATELVHEAYIKLIDCDINWQDRQHFYVIAARTMRRLLIDRAREKANKKGSNSMQRVTFLESDLAQNTPSENILEMDELIQQLEKIDDRKSTIVQLHYYAGLSYQEIGLCLQLSKATVERELRFSKAWLNKHKNH